ncbi:MAG: hypothetical protein WCW87_02310 [Candidatus Paceibacterota bacterium]
MKEIEDLLDRIKALDYVFKDLIKSEPRNNIKLIKNFIELAGKITQIFCEVEQKLINNPTLARRRDDLLFLFSKIVSSFIDYSRMRYVFFFDQLELRGCLVNFRYPPSLKKILNTIDEDFVDQVRNHLYVFEIERDLPWYDCKYILAQKIYAYLLKRKYELIDDKKDK